MSISNRWDNYHMTKADAAADQSKDPSTKVGAVIVDPFDRTVSDGFNGFPRKIKDSAKLLNDRDIKLMITIHAEVNAIMFSHRDLSGCSIYTTHIPCSNCAALIIQSGIEDVVVAETRDDAFGIRWEKSIELAKMIFDEAGVQLRILKR